MSTIFNKIVNSKKALALRREDMNSMARACYCQSIFQSVYPCATCRKYLSTFYDVAYCAFILVHVCVYNL